jgi:DNA repair protein RadD
VQLRPYQEQMIKVTMGAIPADQFILIMAATGSGKTIFFCELCKRLLTQWPQLRIAILAHRGILVEQARDKMLKVWPEAQIGIACSSVEKAKAIDEPITIGTIQTLIKQAKNLAPFDLIIIDEAHRLRPRNQKSQYQVFLKTMLRYNTATRVLGVTATPYQLGNGYCYGTVCRPGNENWFPALHYRIGISDLQKQGHLCEYRAKEAANISSDLARVKVSGDFNVGELGDVMSRTEHVGSAVSAVEKYAVGRKRIVVFCVTIEHAKKVAEAFKTAGHTAAAIHSEMPQGMREMVLREFEAGHLRIICNVGVLTEGWDSPAVDCIVMCRPTKSAALYVQMCGRGLRPHPDKTDVLILDLSNNCSEHGDPDNPKIPIPGRLGKAEATLKVCPRCFELVPVGAKECRACGYCWPVEVKEQNGTVEMQAVSWSKNPAPTVVDVVEKNFKEYTSKAGNRMMRLSLTVQGPTSVNTHWVNEFFDFDGNNEWANGKARRLWAALVGSNPPESVAEAERRADELLVNVPARVEIVMKNKFWNVARWGVAPWNFTDEVPF